MRLQQMNIAFAAVWISVLAAIGVLANVTSVVSWTILGALAVIPPLIVMRLWNAPEQSISESIQEALR